jgi:DNA-binding MarR family transcriptional regulator
MAQPRGYLARHLKMLSLQMMEAGAEICAELDPVLKPTWLSLINGMDESRRITVMDAAREMQVSHVHVQNLLKAMKASGVVNATQDPDDGRRTFYELTEKGLELVPKVARIQEAIAAAVKEIEEEADTDLYAAVLSFQQALQNKDWKTRVQEKLK